MDKTGSNKPEKSGRIVRYLSYHVLSIVTVISHIGVFLLSTKGSLFPGADALQSIVGTCAEIIAGLYGITLASYTFFLSRMDGLMASDMTLDYVVISLKKRFKYLIWIITANVLIMLFNSVFLMYCPVPTEDNTTFIYRLFCNEFVLSVGNSIILILWYAVWAVDPNCLEKEAKKQKKRISRIIGKKGDVCEFIALYDHIEKQCNAMIPQNVLSQLHENKGNRFELTISLLRELKLLPLPLILEINRIHQYYECTVNCPVLEVSMEMNLTARRTAEYLEKGQMKL